VAELQVALQIEFRVGVADQVARELQE